MNIIEQIQAIDKALTNELHVAIANERKTLTLLCDEYCKQTKAYYPGDFCLPADDKYTFQRISSLHKAFWNQYYRMKYLITHEITLDKIDLDLKILKKNIQNNIFNLIEKLKVYLNKYGDRYMAQMVHCILCDSPFSMDFLDKIPFYKNLYESQLTIIAKMRKRDRVESLKYELGDLILLFTENKTFQEDDFLVAGILLAHCREHNTQGEQTARYFKSIVNHRLEENIPQERIIRIMDTLFEEKYLDGYKAGDYKFIFEGE